MTEDEAKTKRCCSGAAAHPQHDGACCGSLCMAWRWTALATESQITMETGLAAPCPEGDGWLQVYSSEDGMLISGRQAIDAPYGQVWSRPRRDGTRTGYCGLVGNP